MFDVIGLAHVQQAKVRDLRAGSLFTCFVRQRGHWRHGIVLDSAAANDPDRYALTWTGASEPLVMLLRRFEELNCLYCVRVPELESLRDVVISQDVNPSPGNIVVVGDRYFLYTTAAHIGGGEYFGYADLVSNTWGLEDVNVGREGIVLSQWKLALPVDGGFTIALESHLGR